MRYTVADVTARTAPAFMPPPLTSVIGSSYGLCHVHGQPGTQAVPAPKPAALPMISQVRQTQPSYCAPDVIYPDLYTVDPIHGPVQLLRDNQMPVPARNVYQLPGVAQIGRRVGGQSQIVQPSVTQYWPQWTGPSRG